MCILGLLTEVSNDTLMLRVINVHEPRKSFSSAWIQCVV